MKMHDAKYHQLETRAAAALKAALAEVSTIKIMKICHEPSQPGRDSCLMVHVDLFGRRHVLNCEIHTDGEPQQIRSTLEGLRASTAQNEDALPIIIAPHLSPEAQALCKENKTGFVDLDGNARLALGEVFIIKRTLPDRSHRRPISSLEWHPASLEKLTVHSVTTHRAATHHVA
ncbi:MAG TPA: hypothetical protein VHD85_14815 [Terracidiphilus sp.]|nr:hypothetical protein [Terracidiphilus sp.]